MLWYEELDRVVEDFLPDLKMEKDVSMKRHTSFHIGGPAKRVAYPSNKEQLVLLLNFAEQCQANPLILGKGTNVLIADEGLDRLVVLTEGMKNIQLIDDETIECDAGVSMAVLAVFAQKNGLTGLEFAHGIPGSLGGAVFMNAGAYGGEMKQVISEVVALYSDGIKTIKADDLHLSYRHSIFSEQQAVILSARMKLTKGNSEEIRQTMDELMAKRKDKQPLEYPSAGSTFKRPEGYFAGALIEQSGLKGYSVGGAQVSTKHAGFVINKGEATCADVLKLIDDVRNIVLKDTGVTLEPEVLMIQ